MKLLLICGPPFIGKGTQGKLLSKELKIKHISTGNVIRQEIAEKTQFGLKIKKYEEDGALVPDEFIKDFLIKIIEDHKHLNRIILDGFPRTVYQVDFFLNYLSDTGVGIEKMIFLNAPEEILYKRAKKRIEVSSRKDDIKEIQRYRLVIYKKETLPAIEYLKTKVDSVELKADGSVYQITNSILKNISVMEEFQPRLMSKIDEFISERNWSQFQTGKDIAISLSVESNEVLELFRWKSSKEVDLKKLKNEVGDVFYSLLLLADIYDIDLEEAFTDKLKLNRDKYPIEDFYGKNKKYSDI